MKITIKDIAWLCSFPLIMAVGQMLFKRTVVALSYDGFADMIGKVVRQPMFYVTIIFYGFSTFFWLWIVGRYTLSLAYSFAAISVAVVPIFEFFIFGTRTNLQFWIGVAVLMFALALIANSHPGAIR